MGAAIAETLRWAQARHVAALAKAKAVLDATGRVGADSPEADELRAARKELREARSRAE